MKTVCVTGASGYLGSKICHELNKLKYNIIRIDIVSPKERIGEFRLADLRNKIEISKALEGSDFIIHCASIHPWKRYTEDQYLDINVKGSWNVFQSAYEKGINKIILTSSIAVSWRAHPSSWPIDEKYIDLYPSDIYSITKLFQEKIAQHFCGCKDMKVISLRPPTFTPQPPINIGANLLSGWMIVDDVASAHISALNAWKKIDNDFEPFFITHSYPYTKQEEQKLKIDPKSIVDKYYPGAWEWFLNKGITLSPSPTIFNNSKAKRILGWVPSITFTRWLSEKAI